MGSSNSNTSIGKMVSELETPCFLVDLDKVTRNCEIMNEFCSDIKLPLRPCTNTHRTLEGAELQTMEPKKRIMCRSLHEINYLAENGFEDILYGYPLIKNDIPQLYELAEKLSSFHVTVANWDAVWALRNTAPPSGKMWSVLLMVDCGAAREGVWWDAEDSAKLAQSMKDCKHIDFKGVYASCENAYAAYEEYLEKIKEETLERLLKFVQRLTAINIKCTTIGLGGTPILKTSGPNMNKLTELYAGNYIFNDLQQSSLGTKRDYIACTIATRIVGHYPRRRQMLIDCGENGLSTTGHYGRTNKEIGYALVKDEPNYKVSAVYRDVGAVEAISGDIDYKKYPIGSVIQLLPWHVCGTSLLYRSYKVVDSKGKISQEWSPVSTC